LFIPSIRERAKKVFTLCSEKYPDLFCFLNKYALTLYMQGPNLPKYQLLPASETEYFTKELNTRIIFKGDGKSDSVIFKIDGSEQQAKRLPE